MDDDMYIKRLLNLGVSLIKVYTRTHVKEQFLKAQQKIRNNFPLLIPLLLNSFLS